MKIVILIMALFILPIVTFSQQTGDKNLMKKKDIKVGVIKKSIQTQQNHLQRPSYKYSDEYRLVNGIPEDFPHLINTDNPKQDADNYYLAKQVWIKNNPARFEKIKHLSL